MPTKEWLAYMHLLLTQHSSICGHMYIYYHIFSDFTVFLALFICIHAETAVLTVIPSLSQLYKFALNITVKPFRVKEQIQGQIF